MEKKMTKATKANLVRAILRYGEANPTKNALDKECKELSAFIKGVLAEHALVKFEAFGFTVATTEKKSKKLNLEKVEKLLGKKRLEECYDETVSVALNLSVNKEVRAQAEKSKAA